MKNKNNKKIAFLSILLMVICFITFEKKSLEIKNSDYDMVISKGDENNDISLNAKEIKFKNVGDEFILTAKINEDATYQNLEFNSSDENKVSIQRVSPTSCKLTKKADFLELVTISVITEDPFDDLSATCTVRAYNRLDGLDGDLEWNCSLNDREKEYDNANEIVLVEGARYSFVWTVGSIFAQYKTNNNYPNTYCYLENEDLDFLQEKIEEIFGNKIINFYIDDESYNNFHLLYFEMIYENDVMGDNDKIDIEISKYDSSTTWSLIKYNGIKNITFDGSTLVI